MPSPESCRKRGMMKKQVHPSGFSIKPILASRAPGMVVLKWGLVAAMAVQGIISLALSMQSLLPQNVYRKDLIQEYLLAKAILNGIAPYTPLAVLTNQFIGPLPNAVFQHPTPHPPPVALLSLPLGLLTYQQTAIVWFVFELVCVLVSVQGLLRCENRRPHTLLVLLIALLAMAWSPLNEELAVGQMMTLKLALLVGAWQMLRAGKAASGGILLGSAIAIKLIAWPLVIFLALRRNWRAAGAAGAVLVAANGGAAFWMGFQATADYYVKVCAAVSSLYRAHIGNFSLWTIGWRVFHGTGSPVLCGASAPPPLDAPGLAGPVAFILPLILLGIGLLLAARASTFDASFGLLICVSLLTSPIAWSHYLILTSIPLAIVAHRLLALNLPARETNLAILVGLLLSIPRAALNNVILMFAENSADACSPVVPFAATLISLVPAAAVLGLIWLIRTVDELSWHVPEA